MGEQTAFDARGYWEQRLASQYTLGGVGYLGLGEGFNAWAYRVRRHVFLREVRALLPDPGAVRVLDIGSGTGFYLDRWHEIGVQRVLARTSPTTAVGNLRARRPGDTIVRFDAGDEDLPFGGVRFDAVSMMDVLYHVVDDARSRRAFVNIAALLEPGGVFVFSENFLHGEPIRLPHQASRTLGEIEGVARDAGFQVVRRRPIFCLMNAPLDSESRLLRRSWASVYRLASRRERLGAAIGAALYPLELALIGSLREGPSNRAHHLPPPRRRLLIARTPRAAATARSMGPSAITAAVGRRARSRYLASFVAPGRRTSSYVANSRSAGCSAAGARSPSTATVGAPERATRNDRRRPRQRKSHTRRSACIRTGSSAMGVRCRMAAA